MNSCLRVLFDPLLNIEISSFLSNATSLDACCRSMQSLRAEFATYSAKLDGESVHLISRLLNRTKDPSKQLRVAFSVPDESFPDAVLVQLNAVHALGLSFGSGDHPFVARLTNVVSLYASRHMFARIMSVTREVPEWSKRLKILNIPFALEEEHDSLIELKEIEFPSLECLLIGHVLIASLRPICSVNFLRELRISRAEALTDLTPLAQLGEKLEILEMKRLTNKVDLSPLGCLTQLHTLDLSFGKFKNISALASLLKLTTLELMYVRVKFGDLSPLGALTQLKHLSLEITNFRDLEFLRYLECLEYLNLNCSGEGYSWKWNSFRRLQKLQILDLGDVEITDLSGFPNMASLHTLTLGSRSFTKLAGLASLTHLRTLLLHKCDLPPDYVRTLSSMSSLRVVLFSDCCGRQAGLDELGSARKDLVIIRIEEKFERREETT